MKSNEMYPESNDLSEKKTSISESIGDQVHHYVRFVKVV